MNTWSNFRYPPEWGDDYSEYESEQKPKYRCLNHDWVETGMKRSWCKVCDCSAVWTMTGWQEEMDEKQLHGAAASKSEE